ncbi:hypothetical protein MPER_04391, partial [Moniliophthora perniciosa FA553]
MIEVSDNEDQWLRSPTKVHKRQYRGRRPTARTSKKSRPLDPSVNAPIESDIRQQSTSVCLAELSHYVEENTCSTIGPDACALVESETEDHCREEDCGEDLNFERFVRMVDAECIGYKRIGRHVYVVQGWDGKKREGQDSWYHMEARVVGDDMQLT